MVQLLIGLVLIVSAANEDVIIGEDHFEEHSPIIFKSSMEGEIYIWTLSTDVFWIPVDNNKTIHCWAKPNKKNNPYLVVLTVIQIDWENKTVTTNGPYRKLFTVGEEEPEPPGPEPPGPNPPLTGLSLEVYNWWQGVVTTYQPLRKDLAKTYSAVAEDVKFGKVTI